MSMKIHTKENPVIHVKRQSETVVVHKIHRQRINVASHERGSHSKIFRIIKLANPKGKAIIRKNETVSIGLHSGDTNKMNDQKTSVSKITLPAQNKQKKAFRDYRIQVKQPNIRQRFVKIKRKDMNENLRHNNVRRNDTNVNISKLSAIEHKTNRNGCNCQADIRQRQMNVKQKSVCLKNSVSHAHSIPFGNTIEKSVEQGCDDAEDFFKAAHLIHEVANPVGQMTGVSIQVVDVAMNGIQQTASKHSFRRKGFQRVIQRRQINRQKSLKIKSRKYQTKQDKLKKKKDQPKQTSQHQVKNLMLGFFFRQLQEDKENNSDNPMPVGKVLQDAVSIKLKKIAATIGGAVLSALPFIMFISVPVLLFLAVLYNSPFAIFMPKLQDGDTVITVVKEYEQEFLDTVSSEAANLDSHDISKIVYQDFEGDTDTPHMNTWDVVAVYMVKYGVGDTATIVNPTSRANIKTVFQAMNRYNVTSGSINVNSGTDKGREQKIKYVNIIQKSYRDMIKEWAFSDDEVELVEELMNPEYLAMLPSDVTGIGVGSGGSTGSNGGLTSLTEAQRAELMSYLTANDAGCKAVLFAIDKLGIPYSQPYRDSGKYYDCSSLTYYAWKSAGVNIAYEGANTAAQEAKLCYDKGYTVQYADMKPGDLIFYSFGVNGRFKNIDHTAIYAGGGKLVDASYSQQKVVYRNVYSQGSIVLIGRPR